MEVKAGYKQTEVGVIPEDWKVASLGDVVDFTNGKPHEGNVKTDGRYFLITLDSVGIDGGLKAAHKQTDAWDYSLKKNDIVAVLSDIAHGNLLGLCDIIPEDDKYVLNQRMGRLRLKVTADPRFVRLQINRRQNHFKKRGQGTSQRHIYRRDFDSLDILFPLHHEQRAIATALSDVDALLGALDRLIAKKRDLAQAAMQQLLTGQTRLSGFHEEWEVKRIGEFTDCTAGGTPSTLVASYWGGSIRWMSSGELNLKRVEEVAGRITDEGLHNSSTKVIPRKSVLIGLAGQGKTRGTVAMNFVELCINQSIAAVFPSAAFVPEYLYYNLDTRYEELRDLSSGDGGRGGLNLTIIKSIPVPLPSIREQTAIAAVLSDMDAELAVLGQRRDKTHALKQAMMQELLTGKIRLVSSEVSHV
jgi:type I restriction enzyme S subunit